MDEKTCMSEELSKDLTLEQVNYLMSVKLVENEINGEKLMQMDIDKFAEVIGSDLMKKYPQNALYLFLRIMELQTKPFEFFQPQKLLIIMTQI